MQQESQPSDDDRAEMLQSDVNYSVVDWMGESCVLDRERTFTVPDLTSYQSQLCAGEEGD